MRVVRDAAARRHVVGEAQARCAGELAEVLPTLVAAADAARADPVRVPLSSVSVTDRFFFFFLCVVVNF